MKYTKKLRGLPPTDAFRIITVGTGAPPLDLDRVSPCTIVQHKDTLFPVDLGYGAVRRMFDMGIIHSDIHNVLITHMHSDHTLDYGMFLMGGWHQGRRKLHTVGPKGIKEMYQNYINMYDEDIRYRRGLGNSMDGLLSNVTFEEVSGGETFTLDGVTISTLHVPHTAYTVAYKFEADGKTIVVSGDMTYHEPFIHFAKGADIAVMDANMAASNVPMHKDPEFLKRILKSHASMEQVGQMAEAAGIKTVVLTHFTPELYEGEAVKEMAANYSGEIIMAYDTMAIEVQ